MTIWTRDDANALWAMLKGWEGAAKAGVPMVVTVKAYQDKRSVEALRFYWAVVLGAISEQVVLDGKRYSPEVWHEQAKRQFIGCIDLPNGQTLGISSGTLNSGEFAVFTQNVMAWAQTEHGVEFPLEAA